MAKRSDLELRFSVFEGEGPSVGALVLYVRLRSRPAGPHSPPEYVVLCREEPGDLPGWISRSTLTDREVAGLVKLVVASGFAGRAPRVVANEGPRGGERRCVVLEATVRGQVESLQLVLGAAGFSGADAEPLRALLPRLVELVPASRRAIVQGLVGPLVVEPWRRGPGTGRFGPGLTSRGLFGKRWFDDDVRAGTAMGPHRSDDRRGPRPPPFWEPFNDC